MSKTEKNVSAIAEKEIKDDFSDEIRSLLDIKGSMTLLRRAGEHANTYSELFLIR